MVNIIKQLRSWRISGQRVPARRLVFHIPLCVLAILYCFMMALPATAIASAAVDTGQWIRINQLGYTPGGTKVAVWCSQQQATISEFLLVDSATGKTVLRKKVPKLFGQYGPFASSGRLDFSGFSTSGVYYLKAGEARSPAFAINNDVYNGAADFCLFYLRQQRSGFNPFLKDSCHTHDGYTMYGPMPDSTHIDVVGGWHDASDYLQYAATTANATWHLLAAYRDFPQVFTDKKQANGLDGSNQIADVLDEAKWGLDWLLKLHPRPDWMFNQVADDRDHHGMRIPKEDNFYGKGFERPVYFINGQPQQQGKGMNHTTGTSSTAGKFAGAFSLGSNLFDPRDSSYARILREHAYSALRYAQIKPGVTQTVSVVSPYIYAEDNWTDDMELGFAALAGMDKAAGTPKADLLDTAFQYAQVEKVTPWLKRDTANHYQYYPFINLGHYELAKQLRGAKRAAIIGYYKSGILEVWNRAKKNAFYRGVPFIWCSNNLTTAFAIQCLWYKQLSGDHQFDQLAQANFDWLFGCNPWGTSMVYGLPAWGDSPVDPHSAFTHLKGYPINGGLVDGPVYGTIYKGLLGIKLNHADPYAPFQSSLAVYHDDAGDYSTNEPTMDGTAALVYLLASKEAASTSQSGAHQTKKSKPANPVMFKGAIIRGDSSQKRIALVFTADSFNDGGRVILKTLKAEKIPGSFFFTGNFYRNADNRNEIEALKKGGSYLGSHSDRHLLYCDWKNRDSMLVTHQAFKSDLKAAYRVMKEQGIEKSESPYFLPPYEWYNDTVASWTNMAGLQLVNFTPGTRSNADYTYPQMGKSYKSSAAILQSILDYESTSVAGLNGFILLTHYGTDPRRTDKLYNHLAELIRILKKRGYQFVRIDTLLN